MRVSARCATIGSMGGRRSICPCWVVAILAWLAAGAAASPAGAAPAYLVCGTTKSGHTVYANLVRCPTAKKSVSKIGTLRYRKPKVTVTAVPGYLCVVTYSRKTKKMTAGSCLKRGTTATGFGWTKGGATVPLPPGAGGP